MTTLDLETLLEEQRTLWESGDPIPVESFLQLHPELAANDSWALDLIYNEIVLRESRGQAPTLEEYQARFPRWAETLGRQFELHALCSPQSTSRGADTVHVETAAPLPSFPGYADLKKLGQGGIGVVYRARQINLNRDVAIKVLRNWGDADRKRLQHFIQEARAIGQVKHPNVVQIYDVGEAAGCPFLSLELVEGGSLDQKLKGKPLDQRAAAQLVETLARGVDYVHQQKIVHCDLKPANVLLDPTGNHPAGFGTPKISDFGFAQLADGDSARLSIEVGGTLSYMAPEQTGGRATEIGPASDVHALGAILYELLTGRPPFVGPTPKAILRQVLFVDPVPPRQLQQEIDRDLEAIVLHCLEKEPRRRYPTARALADDLRCFLDGKPVSARSPTVVTRGIKWARRNPAISAFSAALLIVGIVSLTTVSIKWWDEWHARQEKERALDEKQRALNDKQQALQDLQLTNHQMQILAAEGERRDCRISAANRILDACLPELRSFEWFHLKQLCRGARRSIPTHARSSQRIALSRDGTLIAVAGNDIVAEHRYSTELETTICVVDSTTGKIEQRIACNKSLFAPCGLALSPNRKLLVAARSTDDTVAVWDLATGALRWTSEKINSQLYDVAFLGEDRFITASAKFAAPPVDRWRIEFTIWNASTGQRIGSMDGAGDDHGNYGRLSPDGKLFIRWTSAPALGSVPRPIPIWDTTTGKIVCQLTGHTDRVNTAAFSPEGNFVATASDDNSIRIWSVKDGKELRQMFGHSGPVHALAINSDGHIVASAGDDRAIRLWETSSGRELGILRGHDDEVYSLAFLPHGNGLVSAGADGSVKLWDLAPPGYTTSPGMVHALAASRNGETLLSIRSQAGRAWIEVDCATKAKQQIDIPISEGTHGAQDAIVLSTDEKRMASYVTAGPFGIQIHELESGRRLRSVPGVCAPMSFVAGGEHLIASRPSRLLKTVIMEDGLLDQLGPLARQQMTAAVGDDMIESALKTFGEHKVLEMAKTNAQPAIAFIDITSGAIDLHPVERSPRSLATFEEGKHLLVADDETLTLWDLPGRKKMVAFPARHTWAIGSMAVRPDGRQVATAGSIDKTIRVRDPATGQELYALKTSQSVLCLTYTPDSRRLVTACEDRTVQIWDADSGFLLLTLADTKMPVRCLTLSGDGRRLFAGCGDGVQGQLIVWDGRPIDK